MRACEYESVSVTSARVREHDQRGLFSTCEQRVSLGIICESVVRVRACEFLVSDAQKQRRRHAHVGTLFEFSRRHQVCPSHALARSHAHAKHTLSLSLLKRRRSHTHSHTEQYERDMSVRA